MTKDQSQEARCKQTLHNRQTRRISANKFIAARILVSKDESPNSRAIFAACESLRKPALVSTNGTLQYVLTHGIGSVFCDPRYRGKGYASRMMRDVGEKLRDWQVDPKVSGHEAVGFSILYSDIGKSFYAKHGWHPFPSTHISFPVGPVDPSMGDCALGEYRLKDISDNHGILSSADLPELCAIDVQMIENQLQNAKDGKTHVALVPDIDAIGWHHAREEFVCPQIFSGKIPTAKGAFIGEPGHRIWAIWTRNFYGPLGSDSGNTLHILRLVIEDETPLSSFSPLTGGPCYDGEKLEKKARHLEAILEIAKAEARVWGTTHVELWNPSTYVQMLVERTGLEHSKVEREKSSIASLMWYGEGKGSIDEIEWVGNEKYGWC